MKDRRSYDLPLIRGGNVYRRRKFIEQSKISMLERSSYPFAFITITRVVIIIYLSLTYYGVYVMAVPSTHAPITVKTSSATATKTNPTTATPTATRQRKLQEQYGNQWWLYRLRQQQQKLLQQQERFLQQLRQNNDRNAYNPNNNNQRTITTSVIQIIETEYMDEYTGRWTALQNGTYCSKSTNTEDENDDEYRYTDDGLMKHQRSRDDVIMVPQWTDAMTGEPVVAPSEYVLHNDSHMNQTWVGEWKIAVTSSSQSGWEYSRRRLRRSKHSSNTKRRISPLLQYTHRQRIWLRTVATTTTTTTIGYLT